MKKLKEKIDNKTFELFSKYRTIIMGFATIMIIIFHFTDDKRIYKYGFEGLAFLFNRLVSSGGVDVFLMVSGLGLYYSWKKNNNYKEFLTKRLKRIIITYLIIAIPSIIFKNLYFLDKTWIDIIKDLSFVTLITEGNTWYWYIFFISICYVIFPYFFDIIESKKDNLEIEQYLMNIFTFTTVVALLLTHYANPLFGNINIMVLRLPMFIFGIYIGKLSYNKEKISNKWIFFLIIAMALVPLRIYDRIMLNRYIVSMINISMVFILIQILELLEKKKININFIKKIFEFFGKYSLELYLTHVTIRSFFLKLGWPTYRLRYEIKMVICSKVVSLKMKYLTKKIVGLIEKKNSKKIIKKKNVGSHKKKKSMAV